MPILLTSWTSKAGLLAAITTALSGCAVAPQSHAEPQTCLEPGSVQDQAKLYRENSYEPLGDEGYAGVANLLVSCLGAPDPDVRDGIGYEGLSALLRGEKLIVPEVQNLRSTLIETLSEDTPDPAGYLKPFAVLALSEVIRVHRIEPYMSEPEKAKTLSAVLDYLDGITDFRGFDDVEGWRHGVAHAADALLQVSLAPDFTAEDHARILDTIGRKVVLSDHAYVFGEGERLARPLFYIARAGKVSDETWRSFFETLSDPAPLDTWGEAFKSRKALTRLHNTKQALKTLYLFTIAAQNRENPLEIPGLEAALQQLP
ncbi:MAG: DUF2785 domain-containing protein [Henriciella sp.]|nr:DUF2785 domain-containing protein [Henriciella sp.]